MWHHVVLTFLTCLFLSPDTSTDFLQDGSGFDSGSWTELVSEEQKRLLMQRLSQRPLRLVVVLGGILGIRRQR